MLRRVRAALSFAALWAAVWLAVGMVVAWFSGWTADSMRNLPSWYPALWTLLGASSGAIFALLLATLGRHHTLDDLSPRRLAVWGGAAGAAPPIAASLLLMAIVPDLILAPGAPVMFALEASLGASCAWASLKIARRGATSERVAPPT
jgi:hypothetical protein